MNRRKLIAAGLAAVVALAVAGVLILAGGDDEGDRLRVVASTPVIADLVRAVGGDRVEVDSIVPPGTSPHGFEPSDEDRARAREAQVAFRGGGELDAWMEDLIPDAGSLDLVALIDAVPELEFGADGPDPHWWLNLGNIPDAGLAITSALAAVDPAGTETFGENARRLAEEAGELDGRISFCISSVPEDRRKLATATDAMRIFAARYNADFVGALHRGSQGSVPTDRQFAAMAARLRARVAPAVFPEAGFDPAAIERVAAEAGVSVGDTLWVDTLAEGSDGPATVIDAHIHNAERIAAGLTGQPLACDLDATGPPPSASPFGS